MPWQPRDLMDTKRAFLELALQEGANRRELCRRFGISPRTAYARLLRHALQSINDACKPHSTRRHRSPARSSSAVEQAVFELRRQHPRWGGRKIAQRLSDLGFSGVPAPAPSPASFTVMDWSPLKPARRPSIDSASSTSCPMPYGRLTSRATSRPAQGAAKERRPLLSASLRFAAGSLRARSAPTANSPTQCQPLRRAAPQWLGGRAKQRPVRFPSPSVCAEERRVSRIRARSCLSEASSARPRET